MRERRWLFAATTLIVIAGVRVSRQPLATDDTSGAGAAPVILAIESTDSSPPPKRVLPLPQSPLVPPAGSSQSQAFPQAGHASTPQPQEREQQLAVLRRQGELLSARLASLVQDALVLSTTLDGKRSGLGSSQARLATLRAQIEADAAEAARLQAIIEENERQQDQVESIEHKVTPVGRDVSGKEMHFRLAAGRVAYVPIDELLDELRGQARKHQSWLLNHPSHQGLVGPVRGFRMHYTIARQRPSISDELRYGGRVFRIDSGRQSVKGG